MVNNRIEAVKKIIESGYALHSIRQGMGVFIRTESDEKLARQICQLFPQPLDDKELREKLKEAILDSVGESEPAGEAWVTDDGLDKILALLQLKIEEARRQERERIKLQVEIELKSAGYGGIIVALSNTKTWQALKGGE